MKTKKTEKEPPLEVETLKLEVNNLKKKLGLVWEDKLEKFDKKEKKELPVLKEKSGLYLIYVKKGYKKRFKK